MWWGMFLDDRFCDKWYVIFIVYLEIYSQIGLLLLVYINVLYNY